MDAKRLCPARHARGGLLAIVVLAGTWALLCAWAQPSRAAGPSVSLSVAPVAPLVGQAVTFTAVGEPEEGSELLSYRWDFDDDGSYELNTGLVPIVIQPFATPGTYTVRVQMRDSWGNRIDDSEAVVVSEAPPVASFFFSPAAPVVNQPVNFISNSSDSDGAITEQVWDLNGDGVFDNGAGSSALRSFAAPGQYAIGLRVTDNDGHVTFNSQTVTVAGLPVATVPGPRLLNPFPVVRISGSLTRRGARLRTVAVDAPSGSTVSVSCNGRSCPYRTRTSLVSTRRSTLRLTRLERRLRAGVTIRIFITSPGTIGKYTSFTIRRGKTPRRTDRCVYFGSSQPIACQA